MRSVIPVWLLLCFAPGFCWGQLDYRSGSLAEERPQPIYSEDPSDPWNQIFFALFTKTLEVKISDAFEAFTDGASDDDIPMMLAQPVRISRQVYQRIESGDRAIDPLYPSFIQDDGIFAVLTDPRYSLLTAALQAALGEKTARGKLQRALMQIDLWAAHDLLEERTYFRRPEEVQLLERRSRVLALVAKLVRKVALTTKDIEALPRNYEAGQATNSLPALFEEAPGWIEIPGAPERIHDSSAHYRRAARVFLKPSFWPVDLPDFLEQLRRSKHPATQLDAVALAIQTLLINAAGEVVPSPLFSSLQVRSFHRDADGEIVGTVVEQYDLSRQRLLRAPESGGFIRFDGDAPAYLPADGKDYGFASSQIGRDRQLPPVLGPLRSRCQRCHGDLTSVSSFTIPRPIGTPLSALNPARNQRADYVSAQKKKSESFQALLTRWEQ